MLKKHKKDLQTIEQTRIQKQIKQDKKEIKNLKTKKQSKKGGFWSFLNEEKVTLNTVDSIPYENMYEDGVCQISKEKYNKVIEFGEANYQLANEDDASFIWDKYFNIISSFASEVEYQLVFMNFTNRMNELQESIRLNKKNHNSDDIDISLEEYRKEYRDILNLQFNKGNNGLLKRKFLVFTTKAKDLKDARIKLSSLETTLLEKFKNMNVKANSLDGLERLETLHNFLNTEKDFECTSFTEIEESKEDTRFFVAPDTFTFSSMDYFKSNKDIGCVSNIEIDTDLLEDEILRKILEVECNQILTIHINPFPRTDALKKIKSKNLLIQETILDLQKKATKGGYDPELINPELAIYRDGAESLIKKIASGIQNLYSISIYSCVLGKSTTKCDQFYTQISSIIAGYGCYMNKVYDQEYGLYACLPIGVNRLKYSRDLTTEAVLGFMPFTNQDILNNTDKSLYYGLNQLNNNLIMADRTLLTNPNGLFLGIPGSGKSFSSKKEIVNSLLQTDDDIIICDPESEYVSLVESLNGTVITLSPKNNHYINPLEIHEGYGEEGLTEKTEFIIAILQVIRGNRRIESYEISVIDRCVRSIYQRYFKAKNEGIGIKMPILQDLYDEFKKNEEIGEILATELEIYVHGSLNLFNHQTNVNLKNRLVSFNIRELGEIQKKLAMFILQDFVWGKVAENRKKEKVTRYYIDEFHLLLNEKESAKYSVVMWKLFRKYGGIPTGMTQNVKDLLVSREIENIFDNSDFLILLNQSSGDKEILQTKLNLSDSQVKYITNSESGSGLIKFGGTIVPFQDKFPKDTKLYRLMTTKIGESKI